LENLLKKEKSPYLKQHENNPVHWFPWGKNAIDKAKELKKPIFLSVGYASCHWCHVMAHESFEDTNTAKIMNEKFINIKVDREERPDLDFVFQKSLAVLTGTQGGWPLSMFLDENGVPFTGGTYFPPKEIQGRPNFIKVLNNVSEVYNSNREKIMNQAPQMRMIFDELNKKSSVINQDLTPYIDRILPYLDQKFGGFQGSPKFPQFYVFETLFYFYRKNKEKKYLEPVEKLLFNVCSRGLYDHLSGGIARYTVDAEWVIPHFEKMLYDNILFVDLLTQFYQFTKKDYYKEKLIQTINFISREFINKDDLLGSAYDADSEGIEGKFYVWDYKELSEILKSDFDFFKDKFDITESGNWENKNILVEKNQIKLSDIEKNKLNEIKKKLNVERNKRIKPFFDDKTQTDLNSYWISSILKASIILEDDQLTSSSIKLFDQLEKRLNNVIFHTDLNATVPAFLEDYTYYSSMLINFYEFTGDIKYLQKAEVKMKETWELFYDDKKEILQKNPLNKNDLFVNPVDINDNNIPNGNSIYLNVCQKLEIITNKKEWKNKFEILKKSYHSFINLNSTQMFSYIKMLDFVENSISITFYGKEKINTDIKKFLQKRFFGRAIFIYKNDQNNNFIIICKNQTCSDKLISIEQVEKYINNNFNNDN